MHKRNSRLALAVLAAATVGVMVAGCSAGGGDTTEDGVTYVVNEWGNGASLDRLLAEGPLSARRAAWVAKEVAEAISTAHRHGIAHGRLLPENVMITEAGSVKLIGFVVDAVLRGREQARSATGRRLGEHEADVVNLAALLYATLTAIGVVLLAGALGPHHVVEQQVARVVPHLLRLRHRGMTPLRHGLLVFSHIALEKQCPVWCRSCPAPRPATASR